MVRPDHEPTPLPTGTDPPVTDPVPATSYHSARQPGAGLTTTSPVTVVRATAASLLLSNVPARACVPDPGARPVIVLVWLTTTPSEVPIAAEPVPVPPAVQYAKA